MVDFITPMAKNSTTSARPVAVRALLMPRITDQMAPPLNSAGDCATSVQISAILVFHTLNAFCMFSTIQLSLANGFTSIHAPA